MSKYFFFNSNLTESQLVAEPLKRVPPQQYTAAHIHGLVPVGLYNTHNHDVVVFIDGVRHEISGRGFLLVDIDGCIVQFHEGFAWCYACYSSKI